MGKHEPLGNPLLPPGRFSVCVCTRACSQPRRVCNAADFLLCHANKQKKNQSSSEMGMLNGWQSHWNPHCPLQALRWVQSCGQNPVLMVLVPLRIRKNVRIRKSVLSFN